MGIDYDVSSTPITDRAKTIVQYSGKTYRVSDYERAVLEEIQQVSAIYTETPVVIFGSFSRYLQGFCESYKDLDLMMTLEAFDILLQRLVVRFSDDRVSGITTKVKVDRLSGAQVIGLPEGRSIVILSRDVQRLSVRIQASLYQNLSGYKGSLIQGLVSELLGYVPCLPIVLEYALLFESLQTLSLSLDPISQDIKNSSIREVISRSLIFDGAINAQNNIYALLMRCMLGINKARQFVKEGLGGTEAIEKAANDLEYRVKAHSDVHSFIGELSRWLENNKLKIDSSYKESRYQLVKTMRESLICEGF